MTSYGDNEPKCDGQAWYGMMHDSQAVPWIEKESGIDITPCFDVDGTWNPTDDCGRFPLDPGATGSWENACGGGPVGKMSSTCGPAFGEPEDDEKDDEDEPKEGTLGDDSGSDNERSSEDENSGKNESDRDRSNGGSSEADKPSERGPKQEDDESAQQEHEPKRGCAIRDSSASWGFSLFLFLSLAWRSRWSGTLLG